INANSVKNVRASSGASPPLSFPASQIGSALLGWAQHPILSEAEMQYGFGAPVSGPLSGPRDLAKITTEGEAIGYDYCTLSDHVVIPRELEKKYPYSDTGEFPGRAGGDRHEQLTAVAFVAAKT